jgi:hypothetical protein
MRAYIEILAGVATWRCELADSDLHNIGLYGNGEFTRENVARWASGGYAPFAFEVGLYGLEDFHAVRDDIDIPWATEEGRDYGSRGLKEWFAEREELWRRVADKNQA